MESFIMPHFFFEDVIQHVIQHVIQLQNGFEENFLLILADVQTRLKVLVFFDRDLNGLELVNSSPFTLVKECGNESSMNSAFSDMINFSLNEVEIALCLD